MLKSLTIVFVLIASSFPSWGQSGDEEIKRLQNLVKETQDRALVAEASAAKYLMAAKRAEQSANRCRHLSAAILLTYQVAEQPDKELAALLALQSYNFNSVFDGNPTDSHVRKALLYCLGKYDVEPKNMENKEVAEKLCGLITRNLTQKEWNFYVGEDIAYERTCTSKPANNK